MNVVAINGSPRPQGNTRRLLDRVCAVLEREGIRTEVIQLGGNLVHGCHACYQCFEKKNRQCVIQDKVSECIEKMAAADGILLGSPTYVANVSTEMKALIDRAALVASANPGLFRRKAGAAVVAVRRAGAVQVFNSINQFFALKEMIIPGSCYWNLAVGRNPGEVEQDEEGMRTMDLLGENMAWLLRKLAG